MVQEIFKILWRNHSTSTETRNRWLKSRIWSRGKLRITRFHDIIEVNFLDWYRIRNDSYNPIEYRSKSIDCILSLSLHQRKKLRAKIKRETSEEKYLSNWYNKICYILISQEQFAREFSDHFSLPLPPSRIKIHYSS